MGWDLFKRTLRRDPDSGPQPPHVNWLKEADNRWGVPVLDVRPVTLTMLSTSSDPQCAANAVSFEQEDGTSFIGQEPPATRIVRANLRFPIDRLLADGVLFIPREMEHKWALFHHRGQIIFVRSWLRQVQAVARVEADNDYVSITSVRGSFGAEGEAPEFTVRVVDYLVRSHGLDMAYPAPVPPGMEKEPNEAAMWCFSMFGNRALLASPHNLAWRDPGRPLRTYSLLHIGAARGDMALIESSITAGVPVDLLGRDGQAPLHWAIACDDIAIMEFLIERGSPIDVRSAEAATPLMLATQRAKLEKVSFLLDQGADVNARDRRGFTALHRAAEMGHRDVVRALLDRGATPNAEAEGHTPRSLAEARGDDGIVAMLMH